MNLLAQLRIRDAILLLATAAAIYGCWLFMSPFIAPITWALGFAVLLSPLQLYLERSVRPGLAAAICILVILIVLIGPAVVVTQRLVDDLREALPDVQERLRGADVDGAVHSVPALGRISDWLNQRLDLEAELQKLSGSIAGAASKFVGNFVSGSAWVLTQVVLMIVSLYYFLADRRYLLALIHQYAPLSDIETGEFLTSIGKTINAALYGNVIVKLFQGLLTGLMFWILGLSAPVLFGFAAALVALLPMVGTALVWGPGAIWLLMQGSWGKAIIMALWGGTVVSMADNFLYPFLVAGELRLHPLAILFSVFGGMIVFGFEGLVLGPMVLAAGVSLMGVWRKRSEADLDNFVENKKEAVKVK